MAGAAIGGIAGAFFAVPLIATANSMIHAAVDYASGTIARAPPAGNNGKATP
jgi:predicted PurR-regulated permease PerM